MSVFGKRINFDGNLGTVLYEGPVTNSKVIWVGVQWDDPSRGKHSGEYKGVKYFTPTVENSASFVKRDSPALVVGQSFQEALIKKYILKDEQDRKNEEPVYWGKLVEKVGFEKIDKKQSHLNELIEVGLDFQNIDRALAENESKGKIKEICPSIEELNLSENLFTHWDDVFDILAELEQLHVLFLNKNKIDATSLKNITRNSNAKFESIHTLSLNKSINEWETVCDLEPYFPCLEIMSLGFNNLSSLLPPLQPNQFSALKSINLEYNNFEDWKVIEATLGKLPSLENLKMDYNQIKMIKYTPDTFKMLDTINLNNNAIDNWETIIELDKFPSLKKLRLSRNPLNDTVEPATNFRIFVIAQISRLEQFNGSFVPKNDRYDCERYYINYAFQEKQKNNWTEEEFSIRHPKFQELQKYHDIILTVKEDKAQTLETSLITVQISCPQRTKKIAKKKLPPDTKIITLKGIIQRLFKVPLLSQRLHLVDNNTTEINGEEGNKNFIAPINSLESIPIQTVQSAELNNDVTDYFLRDEKLKPLNDKIFSILKANNINHINNIFEMDDDIKTISHYDLSDKDMIIVTV
jgi:hypothetical protein